ncbi:protein of unknown function [Agrobacterium pusense]|uniref:Uncharacterized protein n=1 Tax=Agrobacterium pusense TaxID=648995 RepID=U4Q6Z2_9HYPH|nr:protein of unknown function [Agrobacterium pusense]
MLTRIFSLDFWRVTWLHDWYGLLTLV